MHPKTFFRRTLVWGLVVWCWLSGSLASAQMPKDGGNVIVVPVQGRVTVTTKSDKRINQSQWNEAVANLNVQADAANPKAVILTGIRPGTNRLTLVDTDGTREVYEVIIQNDIELLRSILRQAVPTANVTVIPFGASVILTGNVAKVEDISVVLEIANRILGSSAAQSGQGGGTGGGSGVVNAMTVGGVHQVQLDVTVARVDRTKSRQRGFNFIVNGSTVSTGSILGGIATLGTGGTTTTTSGVGIVPTSASASPTASANLIFGIVPAQIQGLLQALKTEGLAKLLAEPKLVTQSGRPARFLAGGRQATLGNASGINGPGVVYEDVGTELEFLPIVYGNGKIYIEVAPRVRSVNTALGVTTTFGTVPGFDEQSVRTSVVMEAGQTFAIGGLIQSNVQSSVSRVPILGELPFIGSAFSVVSQSEQEQELVILVTPHLVDPMDCNQSPKRLPGSETRTPDDFELYLETMLELPRGQRNVFENRRYKAAWKNDPTASLWPCANYNANSGFPARGNGVSRTRGAAYCPPGNALIGNTSPGFATIKGTATVDSPSIAVEPVPSSIPRELPSVDRTPMDPTDMVPKIRELR